MYFLIGPLCGTFYTVYENIELIPYEREHHSSMSILGVGCGRSSGDLSISFNTHDERHIWYDIILTGLKCSLSCHFHSYWPNLWLKMASSDLLSVHTIDVFHEYCTRGGDLVSTLPGCVCRKGKDMGPFSAPSEWNELHDFTQNGCKFCYLTQYGWKITTKLYIITCRNPISGQILQKLHKIYSKQRDIE